MAGEVVEEGEILMGVWDRGCYVWMSRVGGLRLFRSQERCSVKKVEKGCGKVLPRWKCTTRLETSEQTCSAYVCVCV